MFIHLSALLAIMTAALVQVPVTAAAPNALAVRGGYDCDSGQSSYCCDGGFDENVRFCPVHSLAVVVTTLDICLLGVWLRLFPLRVRQ